MRYVVKTEKMKSIIEAVKWDGKLETIEDNKWLEEAIKEDRVILAMNDEYDKEPLLLIFDSWTREYETAEAGDYVIKETHNQKHRIRTMKSDNFEEMFEVVEDKENNCVVVDLELNTEEFHKKLNEAKEELEKVLNYNIKDKDSFKVVTKDMYISQMAGKADLNTLNIQWNRISKGHNFVLLKEDPISYRYYNVEEIDRLFERDNLEKCKVEECKVTTCMHGKLDSVSTKQNKETSYEVHM